MLASFHKSWSAGSGGWSDAKISLRCSGHHLDGCAPETLHITVSTMPGGRVKGVGLPPVRRWMAACMKAAQIGAAPLRPVVLRMGV